MSGVEGGDCCCGRLLLPHLQPAARNVLQMSCEESTFVWRHSVTTQNDAHTCTSRTYIPANARGNKTDLVQVSCQLQVFPQALDYFIASRALSASTVTKAPSSTLPSMLPAYWTSDASPFLKRDGVPSLRPKEGRIACSVPKEGQNARTGRTYTPLKELKGAVALEGRDHTSAQVFRQLLHLALEHFKRSITRFDGSQSTLSYSPPLDASCVLTVDSSSCTKRDRMPWPCPKGGTECVLCSPKRHTLPAPCPNKDRTQAPLPNERRNVKVLSNFHDVEPRRFSC